MKVRNWVKCTVGAVALAAMMGGVGCESGSDSRDDYRVGTWQWGRVDAPRAAPAPVANTEVPPRPVELYVDENDAAERDGNRDRQQTRRVSTGRGCEPDVGPGETVVSQAFPTGELASSALVVYTIMPQEVRVNQPYEYRIQVCNLTSGELQNVVVVHENQNNFELVSASPAPSRGPNGNPQWVLGTLGANESQVITVTARAGSTGISSNCVWASFDNLLCAQTNVVAPALALRKSATSEALLCEPIQIAYVVTNTGTGDCENVVVRDQLPEGLTVNGQRTVSFDAGTLAAGQSREFTVTAEATRTGRFTSPASATSGCGEDANSEPTVTVVTAPELAIQADCPERIFLGRDVTFSWTVRNTGDAEARDTMIAATVPAGSTFVSASGGGTLSGGNVRWDAGAMAAGSERTISMTVRPTGIGTLRAAATVNAFCAEQVADTCETEIQGIPAILLEVVDDPDPIRVGDTVTYIITVTNQGSAVDRNIRVVCEIPEEQTFVTASGDTPAQASGQRVTFAPLQSLAPKAQAVFRVTVRATAAANVRFATSMTSERFERPVQETEATYLYE